MKMLEFGKVRSRLRSIFVFFCVCMAVHPASPAMAQREEALNRYLIEFLDAREVFFDCMSNVNSDELHGEILERIIPFGDAGEEYRRTQQLFKLEDESHFSDADVEEVRRYDQAIEDCAAPFQFTVRSEPRNAFRSITSIQFDSIFRLSRPPSVRLDAMTVGEFNRRRHFHMTLWEREMSRIIRQRREGQAGERAPSNSRPVFLGGLLENGTTVFQSLFGNRFVQIKANTVVTDAILPRDENSRRAIELEILDANAFTGQFALHELSINPGYSSGELTTSFPHEFHDRTSIGGFMLTGSGELVLEYYTTTTPFEFDSRSRLAFGDGSLVMTRQVYYQGRWVVLGEETLRQLNPDELDRLVTINPIPLEYSDRLPE